MMGMIASLCFPFLFQCDPPAQEPKREISEEAALESVIKNTEALIEQCRRYHPQADALKPGNCYPISHLLLRKYLPRYRFFFTEVIETLKAPPRNFPYRHHYYSSILDIQTNQIRSFPPDSRHGYEFLKESKAAAKTPEAIKEMYTLLCLLGSICCGTREWGNGAKGLLSKEKLEESTLGQAERAAARLLTTSRLVEGTKETHVVHWRLQADDWDLPLGLIFGITSFDKDGHFIGESQKCTAHFPKNQDPKSPEVQKAIDEFCKNLKEEK